MRVYEELFIVKPDAPEEEVDGFVEQIKQVISSGKGTVEKADKWGIRKLAYRVQKYNEGIYVLVQFSSSPELVREIERRMRVSDLVIKFITVRIDEKMKKIEKRKRARDKRASRRPAPSMAAPAAPAPSPAPAMPAEAATATIAPGLPGGRAEAARPAAAHSESKHSESRAQESKASEFKPEPKE
jgi:small subunit ribosomal protein S6